MTLSDNCPRGLKIYSTLLLAKKLQLNLLCEPTLPPRIFYFELGSPALSAGGLGVTGFAGGGPDSIMASL